KVQQAIERQKRNITTVVFAFNPQGLSSGTSDWNSPNRLAEYIRHLQQGTVPGKNYPHISTIAFLQNLVTKQTVLPVLACKQITLAAGVDPAPRRAKGARGGVHRAPAGALGETTRLAYPGVARHFASPDLVQRMLDRNLVLRRVKTASGTRYLSERSIQ